jgi:GTP-binding protein HflX
MAENLLFATLDPTMRSIRLPGFDKVILSDTVGFISELPTQLVAAFRATLEEVLEADVIVHVRDVAHPDSDAQHGDVSRVLRDLGATDTPEAAPLIEALNKVDLLLKDQRESTLEQAARADDAVAISALTGEGLDELQELISATLQRSARVYEYDLGPEEGARVAWLYEHGDVVSRRDEEGRTHLRVRMSEEARARFERRPA